MLILTWQEQGRILVLSYQKEHISTPMRVFPSLSVDDILLPSYIKRLINFRVVPFNENLAPKVDA